MSSEEDEILESYIEESREHLADIENNLLAIVFQIAGREVGLLATAPTRCCGSAGQIR